MKLFLPVVVASTMLTIVTSPTFADDNGNQFDWYEDNDNPHGYSGVPGSDRRRGTSRFGNRVRSVLAR